MTKQWVCRVMRARAAECAGPYPHSPIRPTWTPRGWSDSLSRCGARQSWRLRDGRRRCAECRYDWTEIAHETRLERERVLRALILVRAQADQLGPWVRGRNGLLPVALRAHAARQLSCDGQVSALSALCRVSA